MKPVVIVGYNEALEKAHKCMSPRAHRLAALERWVEGSQYEGMADWDNDCPISEKAPCVVDPIVSDSIESHVDMVLGEGKFPAITSRPGEDESDDGGLNEDDSAALDRLFAGAAEQVRFRAICRETLSMAMGCGSSAAIYGVRNNVLFGDTVKARWCEPEFADDGRTVKKIAIQYPYVDTYQDEKDGKWYAKAKIYRREIDDKSDVTYKPADADSFKIKWVEDVRIEHGFGECPVVWYPFFRGCSIVGQVDGNAPHEKLTDEIRCHDVAISQRHRAALYAGDPQWTETGVDLSSNPSDVGRKGVPLNMSDPGVNGAIQIDNPIAKYDAFPESGGGSTARKKHPGTIWRYESENVKVTLHQLNGDALKALTDNAVDICMKIMKALAYVPLDPESSQVIRGSLSGKALESLRERQLNRDDRIRDDFGDGFIRPSAQMILRICRKVGASLRVRGVKAGLPVLMKTPEDQHLSLRWGPYMKLDGDEQGKIVTAALACRKENEITRRMFVEKVAPIFGIENVDAAVDAIEKENEENAKKMLEQTTAEQKSMHAIANEAADPKGSSGKQSSASGSGSGGSAASNEGD